MSRDIIVTAPILSLSGYGEQSRFAVRSLRNQLDCNIYINCLDWGQTPWISENSEERRWLDERIEKTKMYIQQGGQFDLSLQVTIPNEYEHQAPINIGYTAGIETDRVSPQWLHACNQVVDKVLVVSDFAKEVFENSEWDVQDQQGNPVHLECNTPIKSINFPFREEEDPVDLGLDTDHEFNFLTVAQWSPRKNFESTVRWFMEEFYDKEVGLIAKVNHSNNSLADYRKTRDRLEQITKDYDDNKCSLHFLHGELTQKEMLSLYKQDEVKAYVSATHGECFGLPLFEAACAGIPVIAPDWSGQTDYLYKDDEALFSNVPVDLDEIQDEAEWEGVLQEGTRWSFPKQGPFKLAMRMVKKEYPKHVSRAKKLRKSLKESHVAEKKQKEFVDHIEDSLGTNQEYYSLEDLDIEEV